MGPAAHSLPFNILSVTIVTIHFELSINKISYIGTPYIIPTCSSTLTLQTVYMVSTHSTVIIYTYAVQLPVTSQNMLAARHITMFIISILAERTIASKFPTSNRYKIVPQSNYGCTCPSKYPSNCLQFALYPLFPPSLWTDFFSTATTTTQ